MKDSSVQVAKPRLAVAWLSCRPKKFCLLLLGLVADAVVLANANSTAPPTLVKYDCDPCIDRPSHRIKTIVHGTQQDPFWQQFHAAAVQAAKDFRVQLDFDLYDQPAMSSTNNNTDAIFDAMAIDIVDAVTRNYYDALIVSVPSPRVHSAIATAVQHLPVFGVNSGSRVAQQLGLQNFVAVDEWTAGGKAASEFLTFGKRISKALFVNHAPGNRVLEERFGGFREALRQQQINGTTSVKVDEAAFSSTSDSAQVVTKQLAVFLEGCQYDAVLLGGSDYFELVRAAMETHGCYHNTLLGSFDVSAPIYEAIALGTLDFTISQQQYLQAALVVTLAAIHATTGQKLGPSEFSEYGNYQTGPVVINFETLPLDNHQVCELDAFPICPNIKAPDGSDARCPCIDRSLINIGGATHGLDFDPFWRDPLAQAFQAATDLGVNLKFELTKTSADDINEDVIYAKISNKILSFCRQGFHGVFVTLPNQKVVQAVKECQNLKVPIVSINEGADIAQQLGILYIGQRAYSAAFEAGKRMIQAGMQVGVCPNPLPNLLDMVARCKGMEDAILEANQKQATNITFIDIVDLPSDSLSLFVKTVDTFLQNAGYDGDWEGLGILLIREFWLSEALALQDKHPSLLLATFDINAEVDGAIEQDRVLFGIDQGSFLQGYLPVWLLATGAITEQRLSTKFVVTETIFVEEAPANALAICQANLFEVCPPISDHNYNQLTWVRFIGFTLAGIVFVTSSSFGLWVVCNRNEPIVASSQPIFLGVICVGTFVMGAAIIPSGIDDELANEEVCHMTCMAAIWLFTLGFTIAFSGLLCKLWRINKLISDARHFRRAVVTVRRVIIPSVFFVVLNVVLLTIWSVVDPMRWVRVETCGSSGLSSYGTCQLGQKTASTVLAISVVVVNNCALIFANIEAYKARGVSLQFSESRFIFMIMIGVLQISIIALPVLILLQSNPTATFFVKSAFVFVLCMTILMLLFIPKVIFLRRSEADDAAAANPPDPDFVGSASDHPTGSNIPLGFRANPEDTFLGESPRSRASNKRTGNSEIPTVIEDDMIPLVKVIHLEALMRKAGIDTAPLLKEAGIDLKTTSSRMGFSSTLLDCEGPDSLSIPLVLGDESSLQESRASTDVVEDAETPPSIAGSHRATSVDH